MKYFLFILVIFCSCVKEHNSRSVFWAGYSYITPDSIIWDKDSTYSDYKFHLLHYIQVNENGESYLIKHLLSKQHWLFLLFF